MPGKITGSELGLQALAQMHAVSEQLGEDPFQVVPGPPPPPQPQLPQRQFWVPPADWDEEHRQFVQREREARLAAARAELEALEEEPAKPTPPAPKQRKPWPKFS